MGIMMTVAAHESLVAEKDRRIAELEAKVGQLTMNHDSALRAVVEEIENRDTARAKVKDLLEALENLENDDGSIPPHAWAMVEDAIEKARGRSS